MSPFLVVAGNLIVDDVVHEDGTTSLGQPGGAALYAALGASLWDVSVGIASVVGNDYPKDILAALADKGIDLAGVRRVPVPGMRTWLLYEGRRRQVVHHLDAASHERMSPALSDSPGNWLPDAYHLSPMPLRIQADWLDRLQSRAGVLLSLDPFDLVDEDSLACSRTLFSRADLMLLSEDELLLEAALEQPERSLARLAASGADTESRLEQIFLKRGARGGMAYHCTSREAQKWKPRVSTIVDTTGAGDAFAGGLLAGLLHERPLKAALEQAVVSASFALEARGAEGLLRATPAESAGRLKGWFERGPVE